MTNEHSTTPGLGYLFTPVVKILVIINLVVFFLFPERGSWMIFRGEDPLLGWTSLTYMFVHGGLGHLTGNMIILLHFASQLERSWGSEEFLKLYVGCGIGGLLLHVILNPGVGLLGASGAVLGAMLIFAVQNPDQGIWLFGFVPPIKAKYLAGFSIAGNITAQMSGEGGGVSYAAHIGGALAGLAYLKFMRPSPSTNEATSIHEPQRPSVSYEVNRDSVGAIKPGSLDKHSIITITQAQAASGCKAKFNRVSSKPILSVPPGTKDGAHLRIPGQGIWGDHWVRVRVRG